eukprot:6193372-Pleurochrysis_carterae.AAC.3
MTELRHRVDLADVASDPSGTSRREVASPARNLCFQRRACVTKTAMISESSMPAHILSTTLPASHASDADMASTTETKTHVAGALQGARPVLLSRAQLLCLVCFCIAQRRFRPKTSAFARLPCDPH